jgi:HSP20 family molecular chaperone IbpA
MAIANGPFDVVFDIPSHYDLSQARAAYQNGFLRIKMPPKVAG